MRRIFSESPAPRCAVVGARRAGQDQPDRPAADLQHVSRVLHPAERAAGLHEEGHRGEPDRSAGARHRDRQGAHRHRHGASRQAGQTRARIPSPSTIRSARSTTSSTARRRWCSDRTSRTGSGARRRQLTVREFNGPGNNGSDIRNGRSYDLKPGDVVVIPAGTGHWFTEDRRPHRLPDGADRSRQGDADQGRSRIQGVPVEAGAARQLTGPWCLVLGPVSPSPETQGTSRLPLLRRLLHALRARHADHRRRDPHAVVLLPRARQRVADARRSPSGWPSTSFGLRPPLVFIGNSGDTAFHWVQNAWLLVLAIAHHRRLADAAATPRPRTHVAHVVPRVHPLRAWPRRCSITGWRRSFRRSSRRRRS